jgi:hypothetical protein
VEMSSEAWLVRPGDVAARMGQARDHTAANWIDSIQHNDGNAGRCPLRGELGNGPGDGDQLDLKLEQLGHQFGSAIIAAAVKRGSIIIF